MADDPKIILSLAAILVIVVAISYAIGYAVSDNNQQSTIAALQDSIKTYNGLPAWAIVLDGTPAFAEFYGDSLVLEKCHIHVFRDMTFRNMWIVSRPSPHDTTGWQYWTATKTKDAP